MPIASRLAALAAGSSLVLTGLVAAPAGAASPDPSPVRQGVAWLAQQDFFGVGSRIDVLQQLAELDQLEGAAASEQLTAIKAGAASYATSAEARAKVSYAGDLVGEDASTWGAGDLTQGVADGVDDATGRIEGSYVTPASQALAVRALGAFNGRTAHGEYVAARDYLLTQQCADGRFRDALAATTCDADGAAGSVDATAFAVLYLQDSGDQAVTARLAKAREWLGGSQLDDGSWKSLDQPWAAGVSNANSTGLAALALGAGPAADRAAAWLRSVQGRDAGTCTTAIGIQDRGAIAYTAADYAAGQTGGLDEGQYTRGGWVYATQQSVAALQWAPSVSGALQLTGPTTYVRAGSYVKLQVRNVPVASRACLTGPASIKQRWQSTSPLRVRTVRVPAGTAKRYFRVTDSAGRTDGHVLKALGAKRFSVEKSAKRVKRSRYVRITVRGMAAGERVVVRYKGKTIRQTRASSKGVYTTRFRVGRATGVKSIKVLGQFPTVRYGSTTVRVVR